MDQYIKEQIKELLASLTALRDQMNICHPQLYEMGYIEHSDEVEGAAKLVDGWIAGIIEETK